MQIKTERLIITAIGPENYGRVSETYPAGEHIVEYMENLKKDPELFGWGVWLVTLAENDQAVGDIGFKRKPDHQGTVEAGYGILPEMRNKGIATESVRALLNWAFSSPQVKKVVAECDQENMPSIKVLEKLGMQRTGVKNGMVQWELIKRSG
ncbi:GNAT family N-acetyltransferase [Paenibacillus thermoaerophilus]|uniref:GNAT family N-acetyltransferase n=1 Tax=Paenibacillus thermoaerophilus TaxID=1215385 RepID=A0ABW2V7Y5_9BACL|nr:GNAT family N-acetyltransferase [Paenibacillus thermoaerophilus]